MDGRATPEIEMNAQVQALIDALRAATPPDAPRLWDLDPATARATYNTFLAALNPGGPDMAEVREVTIPGRRRAIPARLYVPRSAEPLSPGLLYFHGGGWVIGSPATHDRLTRELAAGSRARVLSVDYALAPEHPYPEGLDDCVDSARWLGEHGRELGLDPGQLVIGGDSAGANLAAATVLRLRDEGQPVACRGALLIYGSFGEGDTPSLISWGDRDLILSRRVIDWFVAHYLGPNPPRGNPYFAPLLADLTGFPPSILVVGTLDPLLSDSELFTAALDKAGVPVELHVYEDGIHAFVQMAVLDMAADALARLCAFARRCCQ
jgi:acetyl esterase